MNRRTVQQLLLLHVGHAVVVVDGLTLRCSTCACQLLLDTGRASWSSEDQLVHVDLTSMTRCARHPGNLSRSCGGCRADRLAGHNA